MEQLVTTTSTHVKLTPHELRRLSEGEAVVFPQADGMWLILSFEEPRVPSIRLHRSQANDRLPPGRQKRPAETGESDTASSREKCSYCKRRGHFTRECVMYQAAIKRAKHKKRGQRRLVARKNLRRAHRRADGKYICGVPRCGRVCSSVAAVGGHMRRHVRRKLARRRRKVNR